MDKTVLTNETQQLTQELSYFSKNKDHFWPRVHKVHFTKNEPKLVFYLRIIVRRFVSRLQGPYSQLIFYITYEWTR